jgi:hypothetical protein
MRLREDADLIASAAFIGLLAPITPPRFGDEDDRSKEVWRTGRGGARSRRLCSNARSTRVQRRLQSVCNRPFRAASNT